MSDATLVVPPLDTGFQPAAAFNAAYRATIAASGRASTLLLAVERSNGGVTRFEAPIRDDAAPETLRYAERLAKFLLWAWGGHTLHVAAPAAVCDHLRSTYADGGARAFDASMMTAIYGQPFTVRAAALLQDRQPDWCAGYLSGLLIGTEIGSNRHLIGNAPVPLIGSEALCALYVQALAMIGIKGEPQDAAAVVLAGLKAARGV